MFPLPVLVGPLQCDPAKLAAAEFINQKRRRLAVVNLVALCHTAAVFRDPTQDLCRRRRLVDGLLLCSVARLKRSRILGGQHFDQLQGQLVDV